MKFINAALHFIPVGLEGRVRDQSIGAPHKKTTETPIMLRPFLFFFEVKFFKVY